MAPEMQFRGAEAFDILDVRRKPVSFSLGRALEEHAPAVTKGGPGTALTKPTELR